MPSGWREAQLLAALVVEGVGLVEHEQARAVAGADLLEDGVDGAQHLVHLDLGHRGVDDVQHEVGHGRLLERRAEGVDELVGQLADEADGVGQQIGPAVEPRRARAGIQRVEEAIGVRRPTTPVSWLSSVDLPALV